MSDLKHIVKLNFSFILFSSPFVRNIVKMDVNMVKFLVGYDMYSTRSVADPERFDADPDPNFYSYRERKQIFFKIVNYFFQNLTNLTCVIFSGTMREEG